MQQRSCQRLVAVAAAGALVMSARSSDGGGASLAARHGPVTAATSNRWD